MIESGECDQEVVVEKRKRGRVERNVEEGECLRKAKEEDYEDSSCHEEDDDDLTMEDLLSIAKEVLLFSVYMMLWYFRRCLDVE